MASSNKTTSSVALFSCLNLLFFSLVTAAGPIVGVTAGGSIVIGLPTAGGPVPVPSPSIGLPVPVLSPITGVSVPVPSSSIGLPVPVTSPSTRVPVPVPSPITAVPVPVPSPSIGVPVPVPSPSTRVPVPVPSPSTRVPVPVSVPSPPSPPSPGGVTCSRGLPQIRVCASALNFISIFLGNPAPPCCSLIQGLVNFEAAACLCNAIKIGLPGFVNLNLPISLLFSTCRRTPPNGFQCPN